MNEEYPMDNYEYNLGYRNALKLALEKIETEAERMSNVCTEAGLSSDDIYNTAMQCHFEVQKLLKD